jgi:DNA-binding GntR family transcriptional regulator
MVEWSGQPAYKQVANALREKIKQEGLEPGTRLGSLADLMAQHDVSITVVRMALKELKDEGLVTSHPGKGNFVAGGPDDKNHKFEQAMRLIGTLVERVDTLTDRIAAVETQLAQRDPSAAPDQKPGRRGQQ